MDRVDTGPAPEISARRRSQRHAEDLAFVRRLLAGERAARDLLQERMECIPAMVRHHNRKLGRPLGAFEVEEAVRETIAAVWAKLPGFEGRSTIETWVYRFAMLEVLKGVRRLQRAPGRLEHPLEVPAPVPEAQGARLAYDRRDLEAGLTRLSEAASEVIRMRHFEERSFDEIAAGLTAPVNTVKARYYRGLARLREIMERDQRRSGS